MPKQFATASNARPMLAWEATAFLHADRAGGFVCGALLLGGSIPLVTWSEADYLAALRDVRGVCWWFGAARYEFRWLWDALLALGHEPKKRTRDHGSATTLISVRHAHHRDATNLWPVALEDFAPTPLPPLGLPCVCERDCGGACSVSAGLGDADRSKVEAHALACCEAIHAGIERIVAIQGRLGFDGRSSLGSTAWGTAERRVRPPSSARNRSDAEFERGGAYAARTEVIKPKSAHCYDFDMSMAYTGALAVVEFPIGRPERVWCEEAQAAFRDGRQGTYWVTVEAPAIFLPVLPARSTSGRPCFPIGPVEGHWTRDELAYAIECGYEVRQWHGAQIYERTAPLFREWAAWIWEVRRTLGQEGDSMERYVKGLAVALPGTFGSNPYADQLLWNPPEANRKPCPCEHVGDASCACRGRCCAGCEGECGAMRPVSKDRNVWIRRYWRLLARCNFVWHNLVIGWCREHVHRFACQDGRDGSDVVSINTDGLRCEDWRMVPDEIGPGTWSLKGERFDAVAMRGNTSAARDRSGRLVVRSSGTPRRGKTRKPGYTDAEIAQRIYGASAWDMRRDAEAVGWLPLSLREGLRSEGGDREAISAEVRIDARGRPWIGDRLLNADGTTRPATIAEINASEAR